MRSTRTALQEFDCLKLMRYIGRHAPPFRGKHFLIRQVLAKFVRSLPSDRSITTRDGVRLLHCGPQPVHLLGAISGSGNPM